MIIADALKRKLKGKWYSVVPVAKVNLEHPEVVAHNKDGVGLVPCVAIKTERRRDGLWVYCCDDGYENPDAVIVLTAYRNSGRFWLPLCDIDGYNLEELIKAIRGMDADP